MDAMSHWGVARDVCAYLSHHDKKELKPVLPQSHFKADKKILTIEVSIENREACKRYSGICIAGVEVKASPKWLQERLRSIGLRPINNIVDITNFIQHETGQPLHAFDYDRINEHKVVVKTLPNDTAFITLDEKERKLSSEDLMICDSKEPMCIAGVFGGLHSGVTEKTKNIFLESAYFDPVYIRKTSFRHGLRTDAATRFEKGIDISGTVDIAKRAALLITEIAGGTIASDIIDVYPDPLPKKEITVKYPYVEKLSGKKYPPADIKKILSSLGFSITQGRNGHPHHGNSVSQTRCFTAGRYRGGNFTHRRA
jgi:phenylalanyl-tRNA synthetase beta chain